MRLHRLTIAAMGPFADEQVVDFDALAASGLFLLEGPTGAGKSTVLDAITFALYGGLAGTESSASRLQSHFAAPGTAPFVELDFSVDGVRHRVRRTPAHVRPKRRAGSGPQTTRDPGGVVLTRLDDAPGRPAGPVSTRVREADQEIGDLVRLTRDQFTQVVALPQGEFARFLRADAEQRRSVLQQIFATEHYESMQRVLVEGRREASGARQAALDAVRAASSAAAEAAGLSAAEREDLVALAGAGGVDESGADPAGSQLRTALLAQAHQLTTRHTQLRNAKIAAETERAQAEQVLAVAQAAEERRLRRAELVARRAELAAQADRHEARVAELAAARAVAPVAALLPGWQRAERELAAAEAEVSRRRADLPPELRGEQPAGLRTAARRLRDRAAAAAALELVEDELAVRTAEHEGAAATIGDLRDAEQRVRVRLDELPALRRARTAAREAAVVATESLEALSATAVAAQARWEAAAELADAVAEAAAAVVAEAAAVDQAQQAVDRHQALVQRRIDGMASELAAQLRPGQPCPVCGAAEHPAPADDPRDEAGVGADDVEAAAADRAIRERDRAVYAGRRAAADARVESVASRTGGLTEAVARAQYDEAAAVLAETRQLAGGLAAADLALQEVEQEAERLRGALAAAEATRREAELAHRAADRALSSARQELATARGQQPSVRAARAEWIATADAVDAALAAIDRLAAAGDTATAAAASVAAEAAAIGQDPAGLAQLARNPTQLAELEGAVADHLVAVAAVAAALATLEGTAPPDDDVEVDLVELEARAWEASRAATELAERAGAAATALRRFEQRRAEAEAAVAELDRVIAATRAPLRVADLAAGNGANLRRITLAAFVLRSRFLSVVAAASSRLERMSGGRYSFVYAEEAAHGRQHAGLGLAVVDQLTGQQRDTRSLSGGETFYASLSLALGLADVVSAEAGGAELETLFIDEGFGSLDPQTLDHVLDVIDELREGGRAVGIVSHVAELKDRIPDRLEVRRDARGASWLRVVA